MGPSPSDGEATAPCPPPVDGAGWVDFENPYFGEEKLYESLAGMPEEYAGEGASGPAPEPAAAPPAPEPVAAEHTPLREELLAGRRPLLSALETATAQHARYRRQLEQGGCVPAHFITLTTAIYQWDDLARVLEKYEEGIAAYRQGRRDPVEPGQEDLPPFKRRVLQYSGVVAWYCAMKLELYAQHVLKYEDYFGVFEWSAGGIIHMHLLYWKSPGFGR